MGYISMILFVAVCGQMDIVSNREYRGWCVVVRIGPYDIHHNRNKVSNSVIVLPNECVKQWEVIMSRYSSAVTRHLCKCKSRYRM